ncbi:hypothetical protein [Neolewinella litorea]|uniref:Uncharacterized protein n=1 Tax=Neolewinella litorea TaxID=2562452 RepID=A0A4V3XLA1_9BACT|nr:hypothetical protein [Neolewinella litorea]THH40043.1 hypothetical protein E4021_10600 [Neolewinella litorea]
MDNQTLEDYGLSASEYYEALRQVVDPRFQDAPYRELDSAVDPAIKRMSAEERDEFFGALASIATPFIGKAIGWGVNKIGSALRGRRTRRRSRARRVTGNRSRISHLLKLLNDPRLKRLLAGNLLNRVSPRGPIGRRMIRHVRRQGGRREFTEVTLPEFLNVLKLLGGGAIGGAMGGGGSSGGLSSSVANEYGESGESSLESSLQKLYGQEVIVEEVVDDEFGDEAFDDFESFGDDGFEGSDEWDDEFAYSEDEYY